MTGSQYTLSSDQSKVMLCWIKSGMYATVSPTNWTPYWDARCWLSDEEPLVGRVHLAGLLAVELRLPGCLDLKGRLRAVAVNTDAEGAGIARASKSLLRSSWLWGALWDVLLRHPSPTGYGGNSRVAAAPLSFRLRAGIPGEKAGQFEDGIPAARVRQGQGLRGGLLPGTFLWH